MRSKSNLTRPPWQALRAYCDRLERGARPRLAKLLECSPSRLAHIVHDGERPGADLALRIERVVGIPMASWFEATAATADHEAVEQVA